jgi:hypothetical protein
MVVTHLFSDNEGKTRTEGANFEAFTVVMFKVEVFWVVTLSNVVVASYPMGTGSSFPGVKRPGR